MIPCYVKLTVMLTGEPIWINMANKTTMVPSDRSGTAILHQVTQVIVRGRRSLSGRSPKKCIGWFEKSWPGARSTPGWPSRQKSGLR